MNYSKPQVEIVKFDAIGFMTTSGGVSLQSVLNNIGGSEDKNFKCPQIGCSGSVTISGYTFAQHGNGKNWYYCPTYFA